MTKATFVKPNKYQARHLAQLITAIVDVTTMSNPKLTVFPVAKSVSDDIANVNHDCEFRACKMQCEFDCWTGIHEPPITSQLEILTGSMLLYVCNECGGFLYIDTPDPRSVRDLEYAEKRELAATYNLVGKALNKKLRSRNETWRKCSREGMARMRTKQKQGDLSNV
jgi:hypothetical protein